MISVIIAGGSGTRLWPLSTNNNPKQLLKLTSERTLVQQTYDRAKRLGDKIYVVTESSHSEALKEQLPELSNEAFLVEPGRRNTASCLIMAIEHINKHHDTSEPIAFLSADHMIRDVDGFASSFERAGKLSSQTGREVLVGVEPSYPSTQFGYINKGDSFTQDDVAFEVASFKEKPDYDTAQQFVQSGNYLWNTGYFVGSVNVFLDKMQKYAPDLYNQFNDLAAADSSTYDDVYLGFEKVAIDTALNEKTPDLLVVPANFDWVDVGSFADLHDALPKDSSGLYEKGENIYNLDTVNAYIRNEETKPIAVIGLDNVVVVNTPDGLLVARKDIAARVGEVAKKLN